MFSKLLSASALVLLSSHLVAAQTSSTCNPVKGQTCPDDPAFGGTVTVDFTKGASEYFTLADGTTLTYDDNGAAFTIEKESNAPTITSTKYLFFGTVEAVIQVAPGTGIVSSFVLQSDDLDEIDWEWLGGDTTEVQTNYFSKGDTSTYDRGGFSSVSSPQTSFHTYTIDWSPEAVVWSVDGAVVRTLTYADAKNGATFPQTPMQIKMGTWDGGASTEPEGTVKWAGGYTPFGNGNGPYIAYYKSIKITDRSNGVSGATSYSYDGTSGTYSSIKVNTDGKGGTGGSSDSSSSSSSTASPKTTTSSSSTASPKTTKTTKTTDAPSSTATTSTKSSSSTKAHTTATTLKTTASAGSASSSAAAASSSAAPATTSSSTSSSSSTSTSTASSTTASASSTAVTTSGAGKLGSGLVGAAASLLVAYILI